MNKQRLLATLEELATEYNDTYGNGVTRVSWTKQDSRVQSWLEKEFSRMGISVWIDGAGNCHGLYKGKSQAPRLIIGSHIDTVRNGGKYDGTFGVVAALEALRSFKEEKYIPHRSIEFIAFAEEEGTNFGTTCLGSKLIAGVVDPEMLKTLTNEEGNAWDKMEDFGLEPAKIAEQQIKGEDVYAFLEAHIEQGTTLEEKQISIGVVQAIKSMRLHRVIYKGKSAHAASAMAGRLDPMVCFVNAHTELQRAYHAGEFPEGFGFTCNRITCLPIGNVVPSECHFTIDIRHLDKEHLEQSWKKVEQILCSQAEKEEIEIEIIPLSASGGVKMAENIQEACRQAADKLGYEYINLNSGPAHDAASMAHKVPTGMLFVPSRGGVSHNPLEYTEPEDLCKGAEVFQEAVRILADTE